MVIRSAFVATCVALTLALSVACGQDPVPLPTPTSAPTETPTAVPPTNTPVAGPVSASNIPLPTRAPLLIPPPAPISTPQPTPTPVSLEFAVLNTAREFTSKVGGGHSFDMSGVLSVQTSDGRDIEIPIAYTGESRPEYSSSGSLPAPFSEIEYRSDTQLGYSSGNISLAAPSETVERKLIAFQTMSETPDESVETRHAFFDTENLRWVETEEMLALSSLTDLRFLIGSDLRMTSDIVTDGQMKLIGKDPPDTHVISRKLTGGETELELIYRIGMEDALLRQVEISGELDPSIVGALIQGVSADSAHAELTVNFSDYGKNIAYKSPYMIAPRIDHAAVHLDDGRVLVSGGFMGLIGNDNISGLSGFPVVSFQIYDPETATWTFEGPSDPDVSYDPVTETWTFGGQSHLATYGEYLELTDISPPIKLPEGRIVSVGAISDDDHYFRALIVFDIKTNRWTRLSEIPTDRFSPAMIALDDGRIMVVGGAESSNSRLDCCETLDIVEAYDPSTDTWQTLAPMNQAVVDRSLIPLDDGRILAAGGFIADQIVARELSGVEIYDPDTNEWTTAESMNAPHTQIVLLDDGRVLATGADFSGSAGTDDSPDSEIYNPETGEWTATGPMTVRRMTHTLTLLPDGRVLAVGGVKLSSDGDYAIHPTTDIFDPVTDTWSQGPEMSLPRAGHSAALMPDGSVLIAGGVSERNAKKYVTVSTEFIMP